MFESKRILRSAVAALVVLVMVASPVVAQAMPGAGVASQTLRAYRFLFLAYALAWLLVLGWVVSVSRRLSRLARRLED